jgi:hypothetical protein
MGCPFAGRATRYAASGERLTVRICSAVPYERTEDPEDLPLPSVCFSEAAYKECYHYQTILRRKEIAARLGLIVPLVVTTLPDPEAQPVTFDRRAGDAGSISGAA